jgi:hypothetical protein
MEEQFVCELYRALEAHPEYPIAAPQIYEVGNAGIYVPHGHHENLHVSSPLLIHTAIPRWSNFRSNIE